MYNIIIICNLAFWYSSGESDSSDTKTVVNQHMEALHISEEENSTPEATPKKGQSVNLQTVCNL